MKKVSALFLAVFLVLVPACRKQQFEITASPKASAFMRGRLNALPEARDEDGPLSVIDLRGYDLSVLDLNAKLPVLYRASFDLSTVWPSGLPRAFRPDSILDIGKNPGLGVRALHKAGHKAKNISIAIIGQPLLLAHSEYAERVRFYEEINIRSSTAQLQGCAVASLTAGVQCGTAPEADLFYIALSSRETTENGISENLGFLAGAVNRIIEINNTLNRSARINVLCIIQDWNEDQPGFDALSAALEKAAKQNIFIISPRLEQMYGFGFSGLGREVYDDPDSLLSWEPSLGWSRLFFSSTKQQDSGRLLIPADARTAAGTANENDFVFYRSGSQGFIISWLGGLYALALEIYPRLTPELFWQTALATADSARVRHLAREYPLTGIINPQALIQKLSELKFR
ncbi:MAG: hypothetical protein JW874_03320 [Spirochaetales bacterium]|nr:hypothetical protein [Spirochaetales bacterium]